MGNLKKFYRDTYSFAGGMVAGLLVSSMFVEVRAKVDDLVAYVKNMGGGAR